ncbi:hypothetical protein [Flavobacterium daejeonense]|uniref:hypothetical protein n=1 Tax=Flavobacterium daejeonense TaxID=350893 RepID=UPI0012DEC593|nr:hypothetical protein [Flavobacterium daejeonense]
MNNIYYMIWVDAILNIRKHHPNKKDWKTTLLIYVTWIHALNFWILSIWLKYFNILSIPLIHINLFPSKMLNSFSSFAIEFALPFGIINYFLIFYNDRYVKIIKKYGNMKTSYAFIYSAIVALVALFSAFLYGALS